MMLQIRTFALAGRLLRRLWLTPHAVVEVRPAEPPAPRGSLEIVGLPSPSGGLVVPIERLPFHQSPGRWHFRCPSCGKLKGVLVDVGADTPQAPLHVLQIGWVCRTCAGLPHSRAWPLNSHQRLDNALLKADDENRRPGEKARDWRRRRQRAAQAIAKAEAMDGQTVERLARSLDNELAE